MVLGSFRGRISSATRAQSLARFKMRRKMPSSAFRVAQSHLPDRLARFLLLCPPCPVFDDPLGRDRLERFLFEVGPQLHQQLLFLGLAGRGQFQLAGRHVIVCRQSERLTGQGVEVWCNLPSEAAAINSFLFGLRFSPVRCFKALPESLPVDNEMAVPRLTAFFQRAISR
jgi:hypothetical protein